MNAGIPVFLKTYRTRTANTHADISIRDAIRATTAGRNLFLDAEVGEGYLSQRFGGIGYANNNPTYHLVEEGKRLWPQHPPPLVVSFGAGQVGKISLPKTSTKKSKELLQVFNKIRSNCETVHEDMSRNILPGHYYRFNVDQGLSDCDLWSLMSVKTVTGNTTNYVQRGDVAAKLQNVRLNLGIIWEYGIEEEIQHQEENSRVAVMMRV